VEKYKRTLCRKYMDKLEREVTNSEVKETKNL
jgi:hypothetical protein